MESLHWHDFYSTTWKEAREKFLKTAEKSNVEVKSIPLDGCSTPDGDTLYIDIAWISKGTPKKLFIHNSGIHGVEGFAGSAIQIGFLSKLPEIPNDCAIAIIHCLNPFGMSQNRRWNENNVDLNRNCVFPQEYTKNVPEGYERLNSFINPQKKPFNWKFSFYVKALMTLAKEGNEKAKQALAGGQYKYPDGLFYGGETLQQGPKKVIEWIQTKSGDGIEKLIVVDVHTGLGKYGVDSLLLHNDHDEKFKERLGDRTQVLSTKGVAYEVNSDFMEFIGKYAFPDVPNTRNVCQEFGTYSGIRVFEILRKENYYYQHKKDSITSTHPSRINVLRAFNPNDSKWRKRVFERGIWMFSRCLEELEEC